MFTIWSYVYIYNTYSTYIYIYVYIYTYICVCVWSYLILYITYMTIWFFAVGVWWLSMPKLGRASILRNGGPLDPKVTSSLIFLLQLCEPLWAYLCEQCQFQQWWNAFDFLHWQVVKICSDAKTDMGLNLGLRFPYGIPYGNWGLAFCRMSPVLAPSAVTLFAHIKSRTLSFSTRLLLFSEKVHEFDTHWIPFKFHSHRIHVCYIW